METRNGIGDDTMHYSKHFLKGFRSKAMHGRERLLKWFDDSNNLEKKMFFFYETTHLIVVVIASSFQKKRADLAQLLASVPTRKEQHFPTERFVRSDSGKSDCSENLPLAVENLLLLIK